MDPQIKDSEIYRSATTLLRQYGPDAQVVASMQADQDLRGGNISGYRRWKRIILVVDDLLLGSTDEIH